MKMKISKTMCSKLILGAAIAAASLHTGLASAASNDGRQYLYARNHTSGCVRVFLNGHRDIPAGKAGSIPGVIVGTPIQAALFKGGCSSQGGTRIWKTV